MKSCLVGIAKDEGSAIFEWILYHSFMGFDSVVVYNNNSTDNTVEQVELAGRFADVSWVDWPQYPGQIQAYNDAIARLDSTYDVFCMLDVDEFFVPVQRDSIKEVIALTEKCPFIALNWVMYGSSGHVKRPEGLVTESYTWRAKQANTVIKTITRPRGTGAVFVNPHRMDPADYADASGNPIIWDTIQKRRTASPHVDIARINHYYTKSQEEFSAKMIRGRADSVVKRQDVFANDDPKRNEVHDPIVLEKFSHIIERIKSCMAAGQ